MAPAIPSDPGVKTSSAPNICKRFLRSTLMVSGMVKISRYPLAAATKARAIPVFPDVGSMRTVSFFIDPFLSPASIMLTPIRSLTLERGLKDSSFPTT